MSTTGENMTPKMPAAQKHVLSQDQENLNHDPITGGPTGYPDPAQLEANNAPTTAPRTADDVEAPYEDAHWREHLSSAPYYQAELDYDRDYLPAYRLGVQHKAEYSDKGSFEEAESDLKIRWEELKGESQLKWEQAKDVILDVWNSFFPDNKGT